MVDVPDYLAPSDGLTNANIEFVGLDYLPGSKPTVRFALTDANGHHGGTLLVTPDVRPGESMEGVVAAGHRELRDILRQWLYRIDIYTKAYEAGSRPTT